MYRKQGPLLGKSQAYLVARMLKAGKRTLDEVVRAHGRSNAILCELLRTGGIYAVRDVYPKWPMSKCADNRDDFTSDTVKKDNPNKQAVMVVIDY